MAPVLFTGAQSGPRRRHDRLGQFIAVVGPCSLNAQQNQVGAALSAWMPISVCIQCVPTTARRVPFLQFPMA